MKICEKKIFLNLIKFDGNDFLKKIFKKTFKFFKLFDKSFL